MQYLLHTIATRCHYLRKNAARLHRTHPNISWVYLLQEHLLRHDKRAEKMLLAEMKNLFESPKYEMS